MKVPEPRKLDSGVWFIQLRLGGQSVPVTDIDAKACKHNAELIKSEYLNGRRLQRVASSSLTLSQGIDNYISARSNTLSPSTIRGYRYIQKRFDGVMDKPMRSVKSWQAVVNVEAKNVGPKTLKNSWGFIASVLRENGIDPGKVRLPQIVEKDLPWLDAEQIKVFAAAVRGTKVEIPALLALHSLRRSEILGLTWDLVDLDNELIHVAGAAVVDEHGELVDKPTNKNRSSRRNVPIMIPELLDALRAAKPAGKEHAHDKVVVAGVNTTLYRVNRICEDNGLPLVGVHGLRRSFASLCYHLKVSERETMELGGWSDTKTMHKIYIKLAEADKKKAQSKIARFYKNANKNANTAEKSE